MRRNRVEIVDGHKPCSKCKENKPVKCFSPDPSTSSGLRSQCKECRVLEVAKYAQSPRGKEVYKRSGKKYREAHKEETREKDKERARIYREANRDKTRAASRKWARENWEHIKARKKIRWNTEPEVRLRSNISRRIRDGLSGRRKLANTKTLLGCSIEELRIYLETKFQPGMSWENYGYHGWHIDHIRPVSSFDLLDEEQQRVCFHYTNLQPLWAEENMQKGDRLDFSLASSTSV